MKIPAIQRSHLRDPETLSDRDYCCIRGAERQVRVPLNEIGHPAVVGLDQVFGVKVLYFQRPQKRGFGAGITLRAKEIPDLGNNRRRAWNDQPGGRW